MGGPNARVVCGPGMVELGQAMARELGEPPCLATVEHFPDGELHVVLQDEVAGREVALLESLTAPIGERLVELALLADACRRAGANQSIAVLPYFAYARQDRCRQAGEALGGEAVARLVAAAELGRVIAVDLHSKAAEGWFGVPVTHLTAMTALAEAARPSLAPEAVVVSPDLGGAKRAQWVANALGLPLAVVHKARRSGEEVTVHQVLGDVRGHAIVLVDDIISTGGTLEAAVKALRAQGCADDITVLATHALLVGKAIERLGAAGLRRLIRSDSVPAPAGLPFEQLVVPLAPLLASAIGLHQPRP